jgi:hypothetical protein
VASGSSGSKLSASLDRCFLSRTSRSTRSATILHIYLDNMAPPQTGPKKSSRRSRKARTEGTKALRCPKCIETLANTEQSLRPQNRLLIQIAKARSQAQSLDNHPRLYPRRLRKLGKVSVLRPPKRHHPQSRLQKQTTSRLSNRSTSARLLRSSPMISTS